MDTYPVGLVLFRSEDLGGGTIGYVRDTTLTWGLKASRSLGRTQLFRAGIKDSCPKRTIVSAASIRSEIGHIPSGLMADLADSGRTWNAETTEEKRNMGKVHRLWAVQPEMDSRDSNRPPRSEVYASSGRGFIQTTIPKSRKDRLQSWRRPRMTPSCERRI